MHHFFISALLSVQDLIFARRSRKNYFVSSLRRALKNLVVDLRFLGFRRLLLSILFVFGATVSAQDAIFEQMFEFDDSHATNQPYMQRPTTHVTINQHAT